MDIPSPKRRPDPNELSMTPGGTLFSTTPGGTRIVYDRNTLMNLRNSPLSRTPPPNMVFIPGITSFPASAGGSPPGACTPGITSPVGTQTPNPQTSPRQRSPVRDGSDPHSEEPFFEMDR
eukprot:gnl/Spiro4/6730_TR3473_c1_g1_i1.p2 gnl/Spiro4/6730_TR3473_c1_g1~~gnl/Spiro4/6730_TR3473_c1_g1_i1.p2  ORF type:complete len:136 (+),score=12.89 gnl/Spiro4/6730_TR3473_c1_g1_i1:49-408(+)